MSVPGLDELIDHRTMLKPLTIEQFHDIIEDEGEPYELLDGHIVRKDRSAAGDDPMTIGGDHSSVIRKLIRLSPKFERLGCCLQVQTAIELPPNNEPQPDAAILLGVVEDYDGRHPLANEIPCVIEVADSSLRRDRGPKQRIYATAGIPQYVIINLPDRIAEVYSEPVSAKGRYRKNVMLTSGAIEFIVARGKKLSVPLRSLLP